MKKLVGLTGKTGAGKSTISKYLQENGAYIIDGDIVAFTIGEEVSPDTFVVHIEKAFGDIQGAYPMINQQFVQHATEGFEYINREDDMGLLSLRKAKESYHPIEKVKKYMVIQK